MSVFKDAIAKGVCELCLDREELCIAQHFNCRSRTALDVRQSLERKSSIGCERKAGALKLLVVVLGRKYEQRPECAAAQDSLL